MAIVCDCPTLVYGEQLPGLLDPLVDSGKSIIVIEYYQAVMAHDGGRIVTKPPDLAAARCPLADQRLAAYIGACFWTGRMLGRKRSATTRGVPRTMANRLADETSPYLLQHANNPVDWYPWGEEALQKARDEDKVILLSVGYSACHWCHVMAHESFENDAIAAQMNEMFVNIKVDREERPDIDALYMAAVQAMTGHGGWPMTVFLTPDGKPFYGGTYFPPSDRGGMPGFPRVCTVSTRRIGTGASRSMRAPTISPIASTRYSAANYRRGAPASVVRYRVRQSLTTVRRDERRLRGRAEVSGGDDRRSAVADPPSDR